MLKIKNLSVLVKEKEIIKNLSFEVGSGEIIRLTGLNGTGKTTLCKAIARFPEIKTTGEILFENHDITKLKLNETFAAGIYYVHQTPTEIPGLTTGTFLKYALNNLAKHNKKSILTAPEFYTRVLPVFEKLGLSKDFLSRDLNHNFSGGEKKKFEIAQLILFAPSLVLLDETEAGLDTKTRKILRDTISQMQKSGTTFIIITHDSTWLDIPFNKDIKL